jgi:hypothetical protein
MIAARACSLKIREPLHRASILRIGGIKWPLRFGMVLDHLGCFRPYDGRVLVASTSKLLFQSLPQKATQSTAQPAQFATRKF